ncbi:MAG: histidinol-phosphate transaminase [Candidatus Acidiferrales bacterium]
MKAPIKIRPAVKRMRPYHPPLEGRERKLRLDFNENLLGCSPKVRRALDSLSAADLSMYPEQETTRRELAKYFGVRTGELLLSNGTDEALHSIVNTFVSPRERVLIVEPTFAMYRFYSELAGARVEALRYDAALRFPLADTLAALRGSPRVFFLANPNNPTGGLLRAPELGRILRAARNTLVAIDEAYADFSGFSVLSWIRRHRNLIVTRTFSKSAGLAGLRFGCLFANEETAAALRKAQSPYPVNVAALVAARAAVRDRAFRLRTLREFRRSKFELVRGLSKLGVRQFRSAGNFLLLDLGAGAKEIVAALARRGILLRDRSSDFGGAGYVRVTIGTVAHTQRLLRAWRNIR